MKLEIEVSCCLCQTNLNLELDIPDTWGNISNVYAEQSLCPKHKEIENFIDSQCPGCVGGWADCDLWKDFAYNNSRNLGDDDFSKLKKGICPRRTNGSFSFDTDKGKIEHIDLSYKASEASGIALEKAIKEYWKAYPEKN